VETGDEFLPVLPSEPVRIKLSGLFTVAGSDELPPRSLARLRDAVASLPAGAVLRVEVESFLIPVRANPWGPRNKLNQARADALARELRGLGFAVTEAVGKDPKPRAGATSDERVAWIIGVESTPAASTASLGR
jgi:hypothetical protein